MKTNKIEWSGQIVAVQPRIRLIRSFDERSHSYPGDVLHIDGICGGDVGELLIAVGEGAHVKHRFQAGMEIKGQSVPADDPRKEMAAFYKTSGLKVVKGAWGEGRVGPPFYRRGQLGPKGRSPAFRNRFKAGRRARFNVIGNSER